MILGIPLLKLLTSSYASRAQIICKEIFTTETPAFAELWRGKQRTQRNPDFSFAGSLRQTKTIRPACGRREILFFLFQGQR
jgi:ABC-type sulfate transport system substrate-binding protein